MREAEEGERENFNEQHRKAERNRAVSFQVMFSFLTYNSQKKGGKGRRPENVCNSVLTEILAYFNNHTPHTADIIGEFSCHHCLFCHNQTLGIHINLY